MIEHPSGGFRAGSGTKTGSLIGRFSLCLCAAVFILFASACRETPLPESTLGEVVFYAEGELEEEAFSLEAGKEGYYMASSYSKESIYTFQGAFNRPNCVDCGEELLIEISDSQILQVGQSPNVEEALKPGKYSYRSASNVSDIFVVDFIPEKSSGVVLDSSQWDFGDGEMSRVENPQHTYVDPLDPNPTVCYRTVDENGCVSQICNDINLDSAACKVDFTYMIDENTGFVSFIDLSEGVYPLRHRWDFGDGFGASLGNPGYYFGNQGSFQVCLTVEDATGCRLTFCKNIDTEPGSCISNFSYTVNKFSGPLAPQLSKVLIQWTDETGKVYRSDREAQGTSSDFEILAAEPYENNERGESTRQLDIRFKCRLFAEDGSSLSLDISDAVIAVAHP